jgi:hypothetical protein
MNDNTTQITEMELREASLCLWEAYNDSPAAYPTITQLREKVGASEVRTMFMENDLLLACHMGYMKLRDQGFDDPFDWAFCPEFLTHCTEVVAYNLTIKSDWEEHLHNITAY